MDHTKSLTFIIYSTKPCDRIRTRRRINHHISKWSKESRSQKLRLDASQFTASKSIEAYLRAEEEGRISRTQISKVPRSLGVTPFDPFTFKVGTSTKDWELIHYCEKVFSILLILLLLIFIRFQ